jgi:hypothetical protein
LVGSSFAGHTRSLSQRSRAKAEQSYGSFRRDWIISGGRGPGEFQEPHGIWIMRDGTVVVADRGNDRLQFFGPDGDFIHKWGANIVRHPDHIYFDRNDVMYVTEIEYHRVSILAPTVHC